MALKRLPNERGLGCNHIFAVAVKLSGVVGILSVRTIQRELCQNNASAYDRARCRAVVVATDIRNLPLNRRTCLVDRFNVSQRLGTNLRRDGLAAADERTGRDVVRESDRFLNISFPCSIFRRT